MNPNKRISRNGKVTYYVRHKEPVARRKQRVIHKLNRLYAIGCPLNSGYIQRNLPSIYGQATYYFGTYENACTSAGFDYDRLRVNPRRGRQYYIDKLKSIYSETGMTKWSDIESIYAGAKTYFPSCIEWFRECDIPLNRIPSNMRQWSKFGQRFENIVKLIFTELFPLYIYQFRGFDNIRPDWYDVDNNVIYDAKLSRGTINKWDDMDEYLSNCSKLVIVYMRENNSTISDPRIEFQSVYSFTHLLSDKSRIKIERMLSKLKSDMNVVWTSDDALNIWITHNGQIPADMYLHFIDGDPNNTQISNLELVDERTHNLLNSDFFMSDDKWYRYCTKCEQRRCVDEYYFGQYSWCKSCVIKSSTISLARNGRGCYSDKCNISPGTEVTWRTNMIHVIRTYVGRFVKIIEPHQNVRDLLPPHTKVAGSHTSVYRRGLVEMNDGSYRTAILSIINPIKV